MVRGYQSKKLQFGSRSYQLQDDKPLAYVFSHLILASKFSMPPIRQSMKGRYVTYELSTEMAKVIVVHQKQLTYQIEMDMYLVRILGCHGIVKQKQDPKWLLNVPILLWPFNSIQND